MAEWLRSSFCDTGNCVEVSFDDNHVLVQSSIGGSAISLDREEWNSFVSGVKAGEFDWPTPQ